MAKLGTSGDMRTTFFSALMRKPCCVIPVAIHAICGFYRPTRTWLDIHESEDAQPLQANYSPATCGWMQPSRTPMAGLLPVGTKSGPRRRRRAVGARFDCQGHCIAIAPDQAYFTPLVNAAAVAASLVSMLVSKPPVSNSPHEGISRWVFLKSEHAPDVVSTSAADNAASI